MLHKIFPRKKNLFPAEDENGNILSILQSAATMEIAKQAFHSQAMQFTLKQCKGAHLRR